MSPDMLTLVAAVLVYDFALENCETRSPLPLSLYVMFETSDEKDMVIDVETDDGRWTMDDEQLRKVKVD
jgi:hypothetical protein